MKLHSLEIALQEVPNEISLSFSISGCKIHCKGCHSPELWSSKGEDLTIQRFKEILSRYECLFTCVLFMGGEWHEEELISMLKIVNDLNIKTCLYTGEEEVSDEIRSELTYLKLGPYIKELGGLSERTSNQKFIDIKSNKELNHLFWR